MDLKLLFVILYVKTNVRGDKEGQGIKRGG